MMRRTMVVALAVAVLLSALAVPVASAAETTPEAVCAAVSNADSTDTLVVGYLPGSGKILPYDGSEVSLYPGTQVSVVVCRGGEKKLVKFAEGPPGYVEAAGDFRAVLDVPASKAGERLPVYNASWLDLDRETHGLVITVPGAATVDSTVTDAELPFGDEPAADEYNETEAWFVKNLSTVDEGTGEIEGLAEEARADSLPETAGETVNETVAGFENARELRKSLEADLYLAAWQTGGSAHVDQVAELRRQEEEHREALVSALEEYEGALGDAKSSGVRSAMTDLAVGLVGGVLLGVVAAVLYVRRRASGVAYDRQFKHVELGRETLLAPAVAAAILLLATVVGVVVGVENFIGAIL